VSSIESWASAIQTQGWIGLNRSVPHWKCRPTSSGVATFLKNRPGWKIAARIPNPHTDILERIVFLNRARIDGAAADLFVAAVLEAWAAGESKEEVRRSAARAYNGYQHCGLTAALRLFDTRP
jgi:hypothetical protein